jgi:AcrB/AcrD/AcrF family
MTAFATIFALVPMGLGLTGEGGFISKPLAIVVIGGLVSSTLLTLVLVPALYSLVEGWREKRALRKVAAPPPAPASEPAPQTDDRWDRGLSDPAIGRGPSYVPAHASNGPPVETGHHAEQPPPYPYLPLAVSGRQEARGAYPVTAYVIPVPETMWYDAPDALDRWSAARPARNWSHPSRVTSHSVAHQDRNRASRNSAPVAGQD